MASLRPVYLPMPSASEWICTASSRVGAITMARGALTGRLAAPGSVSRRLNSAIRNAAVLPVARHILPAERQGQGLRLNRRAARVAEFGNTPFDGFRDVERIECELSEMGV